MRCVVWKINVQDTSWFLCLFANLNSNLRLFKDLKVRLAREQFMFVSWQFPQFFDYFWGFKFFLLHWKTTKFLRMYFIKLINGKHPFFFLTGKIRYFNLTSFLLPLWPDGPVQNLRKPTPLPISLKPKPTLPRIVTQLSQWVHLSEPFQQVWLPGVCSPCSPVKLCVEVLQNVRNWWTLVLTSGSPPDITRGNNGNIRFCACYVEIVKVLQNLWANLYSGSWRTCLGDEEEQDTWLIEKWKMFPQLYCSYAFFHLMFNQAVTNIKLFSPIMWEAAYCSTVLKNSQGLYEMKQCLEQLLLSRKCQMFFPIFKTKLTAREQRSEGSVFLGWAG